MYSETSTKRGQYNGHESQKSYLPTKLIHLKPLKEDNPSTMDTLTGIYWQFFGIFTVSSYAQIKCFALLYIPKYMDIGWMHRTG